MFPCTRIDMRVTVNCKTTQHSNKQKLVTYFQFVKEEPGFNLPIRSKFTTGNSRIKPAAYVHKWDPEGGGLEGAERTMTFVHFPKSIKLTAIMRRRTCLLKT